MVINGWLVDDEWMIIGDSWMIIGDVVSVGNTMEKGD